MAKKTFKRVYHHYLDWEEMNTNMWGSVSDSQAWTDAAFNFTSDHELYGSYMMRVIKEWPISCENALTNIDSNRKAWVGHAAAAMAIDCPESIVRKAWRLLSDEQRLLANEKAGAAIAAWEKSYIKDKGLCEYVGEQMLF